MFTTTTCLPTLSSSVISTRLYVTQSWAIKLTFMNTAHVACVNIVFAYYRLASKAFLIRFK